MSEVISIREFARRKGVSDTAIHKHIDAGHIVRALTMKGKRPALIASIAEEEWTEWAGGSHAASYVGGKRSNRTAAPLQSEPPAPPRVAAQQRKPIAPQPAPRAQDLDEDEYDEPPPQITSAAAAANSGTLAAAKKAQAVYTAKIKELEYKKLAGSLVDKKQVYESLFAFGKELREELMNLPDRIIDDLLAKGTRAEAFELLHDSLTQVLEKMAGMADRELVQHR